MKSDVSTKHIVLIGMFAACLGIISQLSIPMPTGVPITLQLFGIALTGAVLGSRLGFFAVLTYLLIGASGVPVFSNFRGGVGVLLGVTGGYLCAYPFMVLLCGITPKAGAVQTKRKALVRSIGFSLFGLAIVEIYGGLQWAFLGGEKTFPAIMAYSLIAFIPKDILLTVAGLMIGTQIRKRLNVSN